MTSRIRIPAPVDPHVHLRGLDWSYKATFASETAAALAGGYWAVLDMPNTMPSTVNQAILTQKLDEIREQAMCDWGIYFGASQQDNQAEYAKVIDAVCGLKIFNNATTGDLLISDQSQRDRHYAAWPAHKPIAVHAEGQTIDDILALVRKHRKHTHFLHISTRYEIETLTKAKQEGLPITIGVCPHHLWLTEDDIPSLGGFGLMKPTLKTRDDQSALWEAVQKGIVDVIESDHAPHTLEEKLGKKPPYGVPGLETTIPLLLTAVHEKRLTIEQVIDFVSINPRRIFNLTAPADTFTTIDLASSYMIERETIHSQCGWSPFEGMRVYGKVVETWIRGERVFDGENVTAAAGSGKHLS